MVPPDNCDEAVGAANGDMRLVKAPTLPSALARSRSGSRTPTPRCRPANPRRRSRRRDRRGGRTWPWPRRSSRSRATSPPTAGTSPPGSTPWSTPPRWSPRSRARRDAWARRRPLTPVEQELSPGQTLEEALASIVWPARWPAARPSSSAWCCRRTSSELPDDPESAEEFAREHPDRQEVRIVAGATRAGATYCALRLRAHDDDQSWSGPTWCPGCWSCCAPRSRRRPAMRDALEQEYDEFQPRRAAAGRGSC